MPFVEIYNEHEIHASAWEFPGKRQWKPHVFVTWNDGSQMMDKLPNFIKSFSTRASACLDLAPAELLRKSAGSLIDYWVIEFRRL